jgi:hypothetical protein
MQKGKCAMEGTRKRRRDKVEGDFNVSPRGGESRQAVRRDRREWRESVREGKVQNIGSVYGKARFRM